MGLGDVVPMNLGIRHRASGIGRRASGVGRQKSEIGNRESAQILRKHPSFLSFGPAQRVLPQLLLGRDVILIHAAHPDSKLF